ncbi:hypothetical protein HOH87_01900 [bacterium]|jgi:hypothetical protein|nr:hypothetical protein [bacterium]
MFRDQSYDILKFLENQGININENTGGSIVESPEGDVNKLKDDFYKINYRTGSKIKSYSPEVFWKTVQSVEKTFQYPLFGRDIIVHVKGK